MIRTMNWFYLRTPLLCVKGLNLCALETVLSKFGDIYLPFIKERRFLT